MREAELPADPPLLRAERLLVFGTGSLAVTFLPYWLNWLKLLYPQLEVRVVVTASAERFVTRQALASVLGREVPVDAWPDHPRPGAPHVDYASWPDTVLVYPATYHFLGRFANGLGDTPMLLALQCTSAMVGIAPALPPGGGDSFAYLRHRALIEERPNVAFADPVPGFSAHTGEPTRLAAASLPELIERVEERRAARDKESA